MINSAAIIENMIYAYIILVAINVVLSFHIFDSWVSFFSTWKMFSPIDLVTLYFKYQRSLDKALRVTSSTVPFISTIYQLLHFSLEVYLKRLPEVTLVCISPTLLFTMKGFLWTYLIPPWMDDLLDQAMTKWRNTMLFLTYGEDFTHPPPLEVDKSALHPVRTEEEEAMRFHPKYGFRATSSPPPPGPSSLRSSRKSRRKEQRQLQQHKNKKDKKDDEDRTQHVSDSGSEEAVSVWDPTWGVISREVQANWRAAEVKREEERRCAVEKSRSGGVEKVQREGGDEGRGRQLPPVRILSSPGR